jgi:hypothetical protein
MTLLRLDRTAVHLAQPTGRGSDPAPDGTHVWLDTPGGRFELQHFVVSGGHLVPQGAEGAEARLDSRWAYWCVWADRDLGLGAMASYGVVPGFGYPLPARIRSRQLVLPSTRRLTLAWHDLTADPAAAAARIASVHASATRFFADLHVELDFQAMPPVTGVRGPLMLTRRSGAVRYHLSRDDAPSVAAPTPLDPDLSAAGWLPRGAGPGTILVLWLEDFVGMGLAEGQAWPTLPVTGAEVSLGEAFTRPRGRAMLCMRRARGGSGAIDRAMNPLPHELGHILQGDAGLGRTTLTAQRLDGAVKRYLGSLHVEGPFAPGEAATAPGERMWRELFDDIHAPRGASNLMGANGGAPLVPWQVAVMRASPQIGDGP